MNKQQITRIRYTHDAMIDVLLAQPDIAQNELMVMFGYKSPASISIIINSDAFKEALARRRAEIVDPKLIATVEDRLTTVANRAMERFVERLELVPASISNGDLLRAVEVSTKGLGMGPVSKAPAIQQNLYVIPAPPRPANSTEWAQIVENQVGK